MSSMRHMPEPDAAQGADALLDAARASILAVGWRRSTLTDVARRAGVSRMTIYRRWPDMASLLADLLTREWGDLLAGARPTGDPLPGLAAAVVHAVSALRGNELFAKIVQVDPELLLPYLVDRRGRTQDTVLSVLQEAVERGQAAGAVRAGDPVLLARSVLLAAHGFALSATTMTGEPSPTLEDLDGELRHLVESYLAA
jgi:AcrR family transcriptional regulator